MGDIRFAAAHARLAMLYEIVDATFRTDAVLSVNPEMKEHCERIKNTLTESVNALAKTEERLNAWPQ